MSAEKTKICYILSYYSPDYIRTQTLVEGLKRLGDYEVFEARNRSEKFIRYLQTIYNLIRIRISVKPDIYLLGFRGYEIYWLIRLLTIGKPLILDHFMSPYDSLLNETRRIKKGSVVERLVFAYEKAILKNADLVLTDTLADKTFFVKTFAIPEQKISVIPVSANENLFLYSAPQQRTNKQKFTVFYYGTFLPLHGVDIILEAVTLLKEQPIHFKLAIGKPKIKDRAGSDDAMAQKLGRLNLNQVTHIPWIDFAELPQWIQEADLCLGGPFGNTGQARRVIAGKTFQFLAMGKPTVVGAIEDEPHFADKQNCLLAPQGDPAALADAILWGFHNQAELAHIGERGRALYRNHFSINCVSDTLRQICECIQEG